jgi:O-antigen ligase
MRGIVNILPWIVSFLLTLGIVAMQAIGGGGRPMFPLMVCYLPILTAGVLSIPGILFGSSRRAPDRISLGSAIVFGAYLLVRTCFGGDPGLRDFELLRLAAVFLVYLLTVAVMTAKGPRLLFLGILLAAAFLQTAAEIYQFYCDQAWAPLLEWLPFLKTYYQSTVGTYANKNHLAWLLGDGALFAVALACWGRLRWVTRGLLLYVFFFLGFGVCISLSRGGVVALMTGLLVVASVSLFLLLMSRDRGRLLAGTIAGLLVAAACAASYSVFSSNSALETRMQGLWMDVYREDLWRASIHDLGIAPFFGMGAGSFQWGARLMMPADSLLAHNDYAQLLSEYGLVGFLLLMLFLAGHLRAGFSALFRQRREEGRIGSPSDTKAILLGALAVVFAQMVHSAFDFNMHLASNALLAGFCLGILGGGRLHDRRSPVSLGIRVMQCTVVLAVISLSGFLLLRDWSRERRFFGLERILEEDRRLPGSLPLAPAAAEAATLLEEEPGNSRYADLRSAIYRMLVSLPENGFREPADRAALGRQLERTLLSEDGNGADWYLWMNQSFVLGHLGDEEGSRRAFLRAMVLMPLFSMVYQDHASVLEDLEDSNLALHYARIASRLKGPQGVNPMIQRLEGKTKWDLHP